MNFVSLTYQTLSYRLPSLFTALLLRALKQAMLSQLLQWNYYIFQSGTYLHFLLLTSLLHYFCVHLFYYGVEKVTSHTFNLLHSSNDHNHTDLRYFSQTSPWSFITPFKPSSCLTLRISYEHLILSSLVSFFVYWSCRRSPISDRPLGSLRAYNYCNHKLPLDMVVRPLLAVTDFFCESRWGRRRCWSLQIFHCPQTQSLWEMNAIIV